MSQNFRHFHLLQALNSYEISNLPLDLHLNKYFRAHKALGSKDRAFLAEAIFQCVRWKGLLDSAYVGEKSWQKRIEIYQSQTIEDLQEKASTAYEKVSFPAWLFERLVKEYGAEKAERIALESNLQAPLAIRVNTLKISREALYQRLKDRFSLHLSSFTDTGLIFEKRLNYFELPEFKEGLFEVQDEGSQLLASLFTPKPGEHFLDFCAGSGGKSLAIACHMAGKGQLYLHDIRKMALEEAKKRMKRAGVQNYQLILPTENKLPKLKNKMDWVMVDAPCSGTGTFRRNPDMKWKLQEEALQGYIEKQQMIFEQGLTFVKEGGYIVYGTCSLLHDENENQLNLFLKKYPLELIKEPLKLLPTLNGPDGFFGAVLKKHKLKH